MDLLNLARKPPVLAYPSMSASEATARKRIAPLNSKSPAPKKSAHVTIWATGTNYNEIGHSNHGWKTLRKLKAPIVGPITGMQSRSPKIRCTSAIYRGPDSSAIGATRSQSLLSLPVLPAPHGVRNFHRLERLLGAGRERALPHQRIDERFVLAVKSAGDGGL